MSVARKMSLIAAAAASIALASGAMAQQTTPSPQDHEQHHPSDAAQAPAPPVPGGPGMSMGGSASGHMMPMMGGGMMRGGASGSMPMMQMANRMAEHIEGRLAFLKAELKITDAQMPVWSTFAEAVRANAKAMKDVHPTGINPAAMNVPEQLEQHEKVLSGHLDAVRRMRAAIGPLYAALNDEQRKTADELMMGSMGFAPM